MIGFTRVASTGGGGGGGGGTVSLVDISSTTPVYNSNIAFGQGGSRVASLLTTVQDLTDLFSVANEGWQGRDVAFYDNENLIGAYAGFSSSTPISADYAILLLMRYEAQNKTLIATVQYLNGNNEWVDIQDFNITPSINYPLNLCKVDLPSNVYGVRFIHYKGENKTGGNNICYGGMLLFSGADISGVL